MRAPRALIPACAEVPLSCFQPHGSHSLVDSMVSWPGHAQTSPLCRKPMQLSGPPSLKPSFLWCRVSESPKLPPPPQLSETLTWLGFLLSIPGSRPGPVQKPVLNMLLSSWRSLSFAMLFIARKKIPSNIVSSFIIFNIRKATVLLPHEWKQKRSFWLEKYC